jgi:hypothetical protein
VKREKAGDKKPKQKIQRRKATRKEGKTGKEHLREKRKGNRIDRNSQGNANGKAHTKVPRIDKSLKEMGRGRPSN